MKRYLEIVNSILDEALQPRFYTSLDVIQRVMGVPMAAVQAIARNAGVEDELQVGACIDENALSYFADAYIRKVKSYHKRARANFEQLGPDEQLAFCQFCTEFLKNDLPFPEASSWNDIDEDAIREQFYHDVKKLTPKVVSVFDTIFEPIASGVQIKEFKSINDVLSEQQAERRAMIMRKVTQSYLFNAKIKKPKKIKIDNAIRHLLPVIAHYQIYISSDEDHSVDACDCDNSQHIGSIIHRTLQMAS